MKFCEKCGTNIMEERFCPNCGNEIKTEMTEETAEVMEAQTICATPKEDNKQQVLNIIKSPKKVLLLAGIVIVAIIIFIILVSSSGPNFKKIYKEHCNYVWAEVTSDGSYLFIDTNPDDEEDTALAYYDAYTAIEKVNEELGLPDSLFEDMGKTSASDGKQSEEFKKFNVSWKYHPDTGLEVTYKKN